MWNKSIPIREVSIMPLNTNLSNRSRRNLMSLKLMADHIAMGKSLKRQPALFSFSAKTFFQKGEYCYYRCLDQFELLCHHNIYSCLYRCHLKVTNWYTTFWWYLPDAVRMSTSDWKVLDRTGLELYLGWISVALSLMSVILHRQIYWTEEKHAACKACSSGW